MKLKFSIPPLLRVLPGGVEPSIRLGAVRIVACPLKSPPFGIQALVEEEDTFLICNTEAVPDLSDLHPIRLMTALLDTRPEKTGSVLVRAGWPVRFLAIVHDVDQEPTWREEWVAEALERVFAEAEKRKIAALGLPLLGTRHGGMKKRRFAALLDEVMRNTQWEYLRRIWLIAPVGLNIRMIESLAEIQKNRKKKRYRTIQQESLGPREG